MSERGIIPFEELTVDHSRRVGLGASATVHPATWKGKECAVKYFHETADARAMAAEIGVLRSVSHENIVEYYGMSIRIDTTDGEDTKAVYFVMELAESTLRKRMQDTKKPPSAVELLRFVTDMIRGVAFLHSRSPVVLHMDLKPENILIVGGVGKLADFGSSLTGNDASTSAVTMTSVARTTPKYADPELASGKCAKGSCAHDVHSIGVIVREVTELVKSEIPEDVRKVLGEVVAACTSSDVTKRPTAKTLLASFEGTEPTPFVHECEHCGRLLPLTETMGAHLNNPEFLLDHKVSAMMKRIVTPLEKRIADLATVVARILPETKKMIAELEAEIRLLKLDPTVNVKDSNGDTPLMRAVQEKDEIATIHSLLLKGADVHATNINNETALFYAAGRGRYDVAKVLLENGADVNARDYGGRTPLHCAACFGHYNVAKVLLANGADVNAKDSSNSAVCGPNGLTPLHEAARKGHRNVAEVLLENGADVNAKTSNNKTPLHLAPYNNNVVALLQSYGGVK